MSEACGTVFSNRPGDIGVGTVGRPLPGVRIRIVGTDGRDVADGTEGELWCAGEFLFIGYWNDPEANQRAVVDGWFRTGDQVVRDDHGRYRIVGRTGLMIKRGGIFVSPYEVEAALEHPAIRECLAVGMPSERWGQEFETFVVLQEPISAADLQVYAARVLGEPSRPVRYWLRPPHRQDGRRQDSTLGYRQAPRCCELVERTQIAAVTPVPMPVSYAPAPTDARERQLRNGAAGEIGQTIGCRSETDALQARSVDWQRARAAIEGSLSLSTLKQA